MKKKILFLALFMAILMTFMFVMSISKVAAADPEFYAVFNSAAEGGKVANTMSFYYDSNRATRTGTVYTNLPTAAETKKDWGYNEIRESVKNVVIDASVANYHGLTSTAYMFSGMLNADSISGCEYLDVSNVTTMKYIFSKYAYNSTSITAVPDVSKWDTSKVTSMNSTFTQYAHDSTAITAAPDVSKWDTSKVTDMTSMFSGYAYKSTAITAVPDVSKWDTSNVTNMSGLFNGYAYSSTAITAVPDVSKWDTSNVTTMVSLFGSYAAGSTAITAVPDVSKWDTSKTTNMNSIFNSYAVGSTAITAVPDVSKWDTSKVTFMANMFVDYASGSTNKLQPLDLSGWDISSLTNAKTMFKNYNKSCTSGNPVVYAKDWSKVKATGVTGSDMFTDSKIKNASTVTSGTDQWSYANIGDTGCFTPAPEFYAVFNTAAEGGKVANTLSFYYDSNRATRTGTVYTNLTTEATKKTDWGYDGIRESVKNVVIDASVANYSGLTSTAYMFSSFKNADSISGCEYLDVSNVTTMEYMFSSFAYNSTSITAVPDVSKWDTSKVTKMIGVFMRYANGSTAITAVPDVSKWDTSKVTTLQYTFYSYASGSTAITVVPDVSKWDTSNVTDMMYTFSNYASGSTAITAVPDVSKWDTSKVTLITCMFMSYGYSSEAITAVPNVSKWDTSKVESMNSAFIFYAYSSKNKLQPLDLSGWDISSLTNASDMFKNYNHSCTSGNPVVYATDWSKAKTLDTDMAKNMFTDSKLKNASTVTSGTDQWSYANTGKDGCFSPEFYAVFNTAAEGGKVANTLSFYYDSNKASHKSATETVYANLPTEASSSSSWGYNKIRNNVKSVVIDESVANYHGLNSTDLMFSSFENTDSISGCEYLDVSNVTSMTAMFQYFAYNSKSITTVPDVSKWDTSKVTDMKHMFTKYAYSSTAITAAPDVSKWDTSNVTSMFQMFIYYAYSSTAITAVPDVSKWNTSKVTSTSSMFSNYAYNSTNKLQTLDLSGWDISSLTSAANMFKNYNHSCDSGNPIVYATDWSKAKTLDTDKSKNMFTESKLRNADKVTADTDQWSYANIVGTGCFTVKTCTLSFDMQGHGTQIEPQTVLANSTADQPSNPSATGYSFVGWYKEASCDNAWNFSTDTLTDDTTVYAKWNGTEFYAVFNTAAEGNKVANTLSFYYDSNKASRTGTVYTNLPTEATKSGDWGYNNIRESVKSVVIDASVANYSGLTSTAYMFYVFNYADSISGCEYLDVSNVTNMNNMFSAFAQQSTTINVVPDVSKWNTGKVTDMSSMFSNYGRCSTCLTAVPDVSKWNTGSVTNISSVFGGYGYSSTKITAVPDVSKWNTSNVVKMSSVFSCYGFACTSFTAIPDVSKWDTSKVTNMSWTFYCYGYASTSITAVPDVSKWNTSKVENMSNMFYNYGASSTNKLNDLDLSGWDISSLTEAIRMFNNYNNKCTSGNPVVYATDWSKAKTLDTDKSKNMFTDSKLKNASTVTSGTDQWSYANLGKDGCLTLKTIQLTVSGTSVANKTYDGTTDATVTVGTVSGIVAGDDVKVIATAEFDNKNVGEGKTVTVTYSLEGKDAAKYSAPVTDSSFEVDISKAQITVSGTTVEGKTYDGTVSATATLGTVSGIISGDNVTVSVSAEFDNKNAGEDKAITVTYSIEGEDTANYEAPVTDTSIKADITKVQLTINGTTVAGKGYNGNTTADVTCGTLEGVVLGDDVDVSATAEFDNKNVGEDKTVTVTYSISGEDAGNYEAPVTDSDFEANISQAELTISDTTVANKTYDGTVDATATVGTVSGIVSGDDVKVSATATFDTKNAGEGKTVSIHYTLTGDDAENYTVTDGEATANIEKRKLVITSATCSKVYDGTPLADSEITVTEGSFVEGEGATYNVIGSQTEIGKSKNTFEYELNQGTNAGNYDIIRVEGDLTVSPLYTITNGTTDTNGTAEIDQEAAGSGSKVHVSTTAAEGYELDVIKVYKTGDAETIVEVTDGEFTMPEFEVTVEVTFKKTDETLFNEYKQEIIKELEALGEDCDNIIADAIAAVNAVTYDNAQALTANKDVVNNCAANVADALAAARRAKTETTTAEEATTVAEVTSVADVTTAEEATTAVVEEKNGLSTGAIIGIIIGVVVVVGAVVVIIILVKKNKGNGPDNTADSGKKIRKRKCARKRRKHFYKKKYSRN